MEHTSENVYIGKLISENTYTRREHEIHIQNEANKIVIDFIDRKRKILHEVKKSNKMEDLHIWQVKYYLFMLEKSNIDIKLGEIDYPKLKKIIKVTLNNDDKVEIIRAIENINQIIKNTNPPSVINKPYCKKCSYYEFCYC